MRRKTLQPPLVSVRGEYEDALAAVLQAANMLAIAVDTSLKLDQVKPATAGKLRELVNTFHAAYFGDESPSASPSKPEGVTK